MPPPLKASFPRTSTPSGRALYEQARIGMGPILARINAFIEWVGDEVAPQVMEEALRPTMELSDHYAPKDTHKMVNSRYIDTRKGRGRAGPHVEVGYNKSGQAPYTIFVHEMPQFYHEPPTQYKFLQRAMDETTPELIGRIAAGIKAKTGL